MNNTSTAAKLAELHAKTDVDLANIIQRELALGMALACANDFDPAGQATAELAYATATRLLTKVDDLFQATALAHRSEQLRKALDQRAQSERLVR